MSLNERYNEERTDAVQYRKTLPQAKLNEDLSSLEGLSTLMENSMNDSIMENFPSMSAVTVDDCINDTVRFLLVTYRQHCQKVVEVIVETNFSKVDKVIETYWKTVPAKIENILDMPVVINLICICDVITYRNILAILVPRPSECMPDRLKTELKLFARNIVRSVTNSGLKLSSDLRLSRKCAVEKFAKNLKRLITISHLAGSLDSALYDTENRKAMLGDWKALDKEILLKDSHLEKCDFTTIASFRRYCSEFEKMLQQRLDAELLLEWIKNIYDQFSVVRTVFEGHISGHDPLTTFTLTYSFISKIILREFTINNASTLGSFHLMNMLVQDYLLYLLEEKELDEIEENLQRSLKTDSKEICLVLSNAKPELDPFGVMNLHEILQSSLLEEVEGDDLADIELIGKTVNSGLNEYSFPDVQGENVDKMSDVKLSSRKNFSGTTPSSDQDNFFTETSFTPAKSDLHHKYTPTIQPRTLRMSPLRIYKETSVSKWSEVWNLNQFSQKMMRGPTKVQQENTTKNERTLLKLSPKPNDNSTTVSPRNYTSVNQDKFMNYLSESIDGSIQHISEKSSASANVGDVDKPKLVSKNLLLKADALETSHGGITDGKQETGEKSENLQRTHSRPIQNEHKSNVSILKSKHQDSHKILVAKRQPDSAQLKSEVSLSGNQEIKKEEGLRKTGSPAEQRKLPTRDHKELQKCTRPRVITIKTSGPTERKRMIEFLKKTLMSKKEE